MHECLIGYGDVHIINHIKSITKLFLKTAVIHFLRFSLRKCISLANHHIFQALLMSHISASVSSINVDECWRRRFVILGSWSTPTWGQRLTFIRSFCDVSLPSISCVRFGVMWVMTASGCWLFHWYTHDLTKKISSSSGPQLIACICSSLSSMQPLGWHFVFIDMIPSHHRFISHFYIGCSCKSELTNSASRASGVSPISPVSICSALVV